MRWSLSSRPCASPLGFIDGKVLRYVVPLLMTTFLLPACAHRSAIADETRANCHEEIEVLEKLAEGRTATLTIREYPKGIREVDGEPREELELHWQAFDRSFVLDVSRAVDSQDSTEEPGPRGYSGKLQGEHADLVVLFKWPSGAWEGEIKIGRQLFVIRAQCGHRAVGVPNPRSLIFFQSYPEKPEL